MKSPKSPPDMSRRDFFKMAGAGVALSAVSKVAMAALPEIVSAEKASTQAPGQL